MGLLDRLRGKPTIADFAAEMGESKRTGDVALTAEAGTS
jgi:hypothetical protein